MLGDIGRTIKHLHDITGMVITFMTLGTYMPNEMWAIDDRCSGSADHYIIPIRGVQPYDPYVITSYFMSGLAALVIAENLGKAGEVIAHLIIFDPIFIPACECQSLKSSDWTARIINRTSQNFLEIDEKWKTKLSVEIGKNLEPCGS